ncbi:hypothetical protein AR276_19265 [Stenotrophomonas maltophilia]|nr:hypothetical protein AR276_19265 [Stenotrophomonas maltophilia]
MSQPFTNRVHCRFGSILDEKPVHSGQQLHAEWRFKPIDQIGRRLQCWEVLLRLSSNICLDELLSTVIKPNHVKWIRITDALVAMQIAPVKTIQQVAQPVRIWTILVRCET